MRSLVLSTDRDTEAMVLVAAGPWDRFRGLMARRTVPAGYDGVVFPRCSSLHTCFMRFPLDVVFVREGLVVRVARNVRPWRFIFGKSGSDAIEFPAGTADQLRLEPGVMLWPEAPAAIGMASDVSR